MHLLNQELHPRGQVVLQLQEYPSQILQPPFPFPFSPSTLKSEGSILRLAVPLQRRHRYYCAKEVGHLPPTLHLDKVSLRRVDFDHKLELYLSRLGVSVRVLEGLLEIEIGTDGT